MKNSAKEMRRPGAKNLRRQKTMIWVKHFVKLFIILALVIFSSMIVRTFRSTENAFIMQVVILFVNVIIGIIIGSEKIFKEIKKQGKWRINKPKAIVLGIPFLFLSLSIFIYYTFIIPIFDIVTRFFISNGSTFLGSIQVLLGYIVITCFYRETVNEDFVQGE